jgi:hypothetical protein
MSSQDQRVLAIAGTGQSGSTLLTRMLGQIPGFVAIGEVGRLWDKGILANTECGCGQPFHQCPFWRQVGDRAFGGWARVDAERAIALRDRVQPIKRRVALPRMLPVLLAPSLSPGYAAARREYIALIARVFEAARNVSGAHTVVDSMKLAAHVYMLRGLPDTDVRVLHNVRDPRGVAYSNLRKVRKVGGTEPYRGRRHPVRTTVRWVWTNGSLEILGRLDVPTKIVRYEAVVADPRTALVEILRFAGVEPSDDDLAFIDGTTLSLSPSHLVAGNRTRMLSGPITLREDEGWRSGLPPAQQRIVASLTWPMRRRYSSQRLDPISRARTNGST